MSKGPTQNLARQAEVVGSLALEAMPSISESPAPDPLATTHFSFSVDSSQAVELDQGVEQSMSRSEINLQKMQRAESASPASFFQRRSAFDGTRTVLDRLVDWLAAALKRLEKMIGGMFVKKPAPPVKFVTKSQEEIEREKRERKEELLKKARRMRQR